MFPAGIAGALLAAAFVATGGIGAAANASSPPDFGTSVHIFSPGMDQAAIQAELNAISTVQVHNEFGARRDAILFQPGTYGSSTNPLSFQVGYYTTVAGLGQSPGDVVINGEIEVLNSVCSGTGDQFGCVGLTNFWRSLSNLTLNVTRSSKTVYAPVPVDGETLGCVNSNELWAVSQAAPMRRVAINGGLLFLFDYCAPKQYTSGGFIADSRFSGVINATQQQFFARNSNLGFWSNAVWNQVFMGDTGAPAQSFPNPTYTTLATSSVIREGPYLYVDAAGKYNVFVPALQHNTSGPSWAAGPTPGMPISIEKFFVASPADSGATINAQLNRGQNLILTPGVYNLEQPIEVTRPDTVVLGLGMATLIPQHGAPAMDVHSNHGVLISGVIFEAGAHGTQALLQVGSGHEADPQASASDPSGLYDVFFRVGGAQAGKVETALVVNSDNVILDDIWAWRADHGNGVGWTVNTADTGVVVNGDNVSAYGLFVEHFQKYEAIWNGNGGTDVFFQNEMPYDVPNQNAWTEAAGIDGYAAFKVASNVTSFHGYGMGSYSFFNQGLDIFAERAFEVPDSLPAGSLQDLLTIFLDPAHGKGGIRHVINETGGASTIANHDVPVTVVSYP
ncbi:MAG: adenylyl cyclase [Chloroflexi bacterium]|nr:MAG: adenylyl cyclase [Chloroflexota bacterium]